MSFYQTFSQLPGYALILFALGAESVFGSDQQEKDLDITAIRNSHWAWKPLENIQVPDLKEADPSRAPIDKFILSELEKRGISPANPADPATLLRRVHLDLVGLPPTPEEQEAFRKDPSDQAFAAVVDKLLNRPQYGERWGRHWLDVARYAETKGYEGDEFKPYTWRYRDYVIDALNRDLPYSHFITEQLAGDEIEGSDRRTQIATTFLSLGTFDTIAADGEVARYDTLDDIVATTAMTFLGQTIQCARCHDHKFEPISQVDYYRMLAAFESLDVSKNGLPIGTEEDFHRHREAEEHFEATSLQPQLEAEEKLWLPLLDYLRREGHPEGKKQHLDEKNLTLAMEAIKTSISERSDEHRSTLERERGRIRAAVREIANEEDTQKLKECEQRIKEAEKERPQAMMAWIYPERGSKPHTTQLRIRGDVHQKGEEIAFGLPAVLDRGDLPEAIAKDKSSGRRLALAQWITGPGAPLAARVMVNRVWQYHFGRGFVPEANNFGVNGGSPSHPELLDWLAKQFVEGGWTLKPLHRLIVLSDTYRLSSSHPDPESDPENRLFSRWPIHRLEAEAIRDSVLAASGKLNLKMEGPGIYPPFEGQVVGASSRSDWEKSDEVEASRRSVYIFAKRSIPFPDLATLGSPDSSGSCGQRSVSTTAVQSLLMMNGRFATEQSGHLAERLKKDNGTTNKEAQIRRAFELLLCRSPRTDELNHSLEFMENAGGEIMEAKVVDPLAALCLVLMNTNEFVYRN